MSTDVYTCECGNQLSCCTVCEAAHLEEMRAITLENGLIRKELALIRAEEKKMAGALEKAWAERDVAVAQRDAARTERDEFKRIGQGFERDSRSFFEQSCNNLERAEFAEARQLDAGRERDEALQRADRLEGEAAAMREALAHAERALRWAMDGRFDDYDGSGVCTLAADVTDAHGVVLAALAPDAGKTLLDRLAAWKELAQALDDYCAATRLGNMPGNYNIDRVRDARARLAALSEVVP